MHESHSNGSGSGARPAPVDQAARRGRRRHDCTINPVESEDASIVTTNSRYSTKRTLTGPPPSGGPQAILDAYHDQLKDAVRYATERGFARSWGADGLPQAKVFVGPRDERDRPECLLVLRAQAAFDFAWRMYDWAMGQKQAAERARDGSGLAPWRPNLCAARDQLVPGAASPLRPASKARATG